VSVWFKAAGGKRGLLPEIDKHIPAKFGRYFEPFCGGAAVYFHLVETGRSGLVAHLNDANPHMMAAYAAVQNRLPELLRHLRAHEAHYYSGGRDVTDRTKKRREAYYYGVRSADPDPVKKQAEAAARFLFLNRAGFNGLYRVNKSGKFNVPHGKWKTPPTFCDEGTLTAASRALLGVTLTCEDFVKALKHVRRGDFVYADPPYIPVSATADFTTYTADGFSGEDQIRLRDEALRLKKLGVRVLLSNRDHPIVRKLYARGFEMRRIEARRYINSRSDRRGPAGEVLIW